MTEGIVIERKTNGEQPPPGVKVSGTADAPYDQGNGAATAPASEPQDAPADDMTARSNRYVGTSSSVPSIGKPSNRRPQPPSNPTRSKATPEKQDQAKAEPTKASSTDVAEAQKEAGVATNGSTLDTTPRSSDKAAKRLASLERDVSPGTMPDGSHAQTSGDRGESYTPTTLSKIKNKFRIGGGS